MKKVLLSFAIVAMVLSSCDLFDELDNVEFNPTYTATYDVNVTNDSIKLEKTIDLTSDEDIEEYQSKLTQVTVDSVILKVEGYTGGTNNILSGSLKYGEVNATSQILFAAIPNLPIAEGAKIKLVPSQTTLNAIQEVLTSQRAIKVYLRGKATSTANFTLNAVFYMSVKADALN